MSDAEKAPYPHVESPDLPAIERRILARWSADETFEKSVENRPASDSAGANNEYVFYDGPPFANGLPHYGHLLTGYVKDVVPRYRTMRGSASSAASGGTATASRPRWRPRRSSASAAARRSSSTASTASTTTAAPRCSSTPRSGSGTSPARPAGSTSRTTTRRWTSTTWSRVIWAFKQLWDKGLIYEAYRVMPYSWGAETPLSNFEIRLDDATRPAPGPGGDRRVRRSTPAEGDRRAAEDAPARLDDHNAVDPAVEPRARRRPRPRLRRHARDADGAA